MIWVDQTLERVVSLVISSCCFVLCYLRDDCEPGCYRELEDLFLKLCFLMRPGTPAATMCDGVRMCEEVLILRLLERFEGKVPEWKPSSWCSWVVTSVFIYVGDRN